MSERIFLDRLRQQFPSRPPVQIGIGDDGAVLSPSASQQVVVTDMLLDGVHFDLSSTQPQLVARKALTVNISDLAAMGCRPTSAFLSIALPRERAADEFLTLLYEGIEQTANAFGVCIAGGDTNVWDNPFAINVTMVGQPFGDRCLLRSGASAGDILAVTGPLGGSLNSGRHLTFEPRLDVAEWVAHSAEVTAMMDLSDGLAIDLARMMQASETGASLEADSIPVHDDVSETETDRLHRAMSDGEDFEMLVSLSEWPTETPDGVKLFRIGRVTEAEGKLYVTSKGVQTEILAENGYEHF